jgi:para-nitrobenzyl esterase
MKPTINRRSFVSGAALGGAALGASGILGGVLNQARAAASKDGSGKDSSGKDSSGPAPVANTSSGKIRGVLQANKVHAFRGIPYGAPTGGANRFMPPAKPEAWTGVKDTVEWGPEAPQGPHTEIPEVAATIPKLAISEDCLHLNVWTNGLDARKRPVMVWLHGGGFTSGNGSYSMYDGANLARKHDVVTVTVNHRLNSFGFLYLAGIGGAKYAQSGNVGILDVVAALEWVRDNIANFGGDPGNVTIFGQSGGAGKVSTLLAMPSAKGLFHRAIVQSGANLQGISTGDATKTARTLMDQLGVKTADELQQIPMDRLIAATVAARGLRLGPVVDGKALPGAPFDPAAPAMSANVPLLIGTTEFEINFFPSTKLDPIDDAELHAAVKQATHAEDAEVDKLIAVYRKGRSSASDIDLAEIIASDGFRSSVITEAERKAAQPAPVYMYYFTWKSPVRDGKLKAFHTLEIPFALANVDESKSMTGSGADRYPLQEKMSGAWAAFARSGNPNHKGLPDWPAFNPDRRATMIFDNQCKVVNDPHGEERLALAALRPAPRS